jgi:hypothetical protein
MRHLEAFVDDAITTLKANLPARIDAINTEMTDFDLVKPGNDRYLFGGEPGTAVVLEYPSIEVAATDWRLSNADLYQSRWDAAITVMIRALLEDTDFQRLYKSTMRYGRCILETMLTPDAFGTHEKVLDARGFYRVNPETGERAEFLGGALVIFSIESLEARP